MPDISSYIARDPFIINVLIPLVRSDRHISLRHGFCTSLERLTLAPFRLVPTSYAYDKQFDKALHIYLRLKRGDVFTLISKHNLFESIRDKIVLLMEFDPVQAAQVGISHHASSPHNACHTRVVCFGF